MDVIIKFCSCVQQIKQIWYRFLYNKVNPYPAKLIYLNFHSLEVVSRYRNPQLQVAENYSQRFANLDV